jgi:hypothetical protein
VQQQASSQLLAEGEQPFQLGTTDPGDDKGA